jgi:hypothetical protein
MSLFGEADENGHSSHFWLAAVLSVTEISLFSVFKGLVWLVAGHQCKDGGIDKQVMKWQMTYGLELLLAHWLGLR